MSLELRIRQTIDAISAATAGECAWSDVAQALVTLVDAGTNTLWVGDPAVGLVDILSTTVTASAERSYSEYYYQKDPWSLRGAALATPGPHIGTDYVTERELRKSEIYADFFQPLGMFHVLGSLTPLGGGGGFVALGLHRPERARPFDDSDKLAVAEIIPFLRRSMRMRHELRLATGATHGAMAGLDAASLPALAVDRAKRILFANAAALKLLQTRRGVASRGGRCVAVDPADADALSALLKQASSGGLGGMLRLRAPPGEAPLTLLATRPVDGDRSGVTVLLLLDPAARRAHAKAALLQTMHGLTAAEAEVAEAATRGEAAAAIAAMRGTSEATVRAQLRGVLAKTGAENLRVLSVMVAALPEVAG
jgi:DNA-binding NarL/FixJ family response regulator